MANVWEEQPASVLAAGRFAGDGARLDANVGTSRTLVFFVPVGRYQLLRFRAQLFAVSASIPLAARLQDKNHKLIYGNNLYDIWTVADSSWFHDLVYGREREVITRYNLVNGPNNRTATPDINVDARFPNPTWRASVPSEENRRRIAYLFEHGRYNLPNALRPECHRDFEHTYNSMYGRLRWNRPAQTITSGYGSMGQGRYVHPGRRRTLTPHEAARLQTIPDWFDFAAAQTRTTLARMIGNAVPPLVALDIGRLLLPLFVSTASEEVDAGGRELRRAA